MASVAGVMTGLSHRFQNPNFVSKVRMVMNMMLVGIQGFPLVLHPKTGLAFYNNRAGLSKSTNYQFCYKTSFKCILYLFKVFELIV